MTQYDKMPVEQIVMSQADLRPQFSGSRQ